MSRDSKLLTLCISRVSFTASDMWETLHIHWTNEWWWAVLRVGTLPSETLQNSQFTPHCLSIRIDKKIYSMWLYVFLNWPFRTKSPHFQNRIFGFFISRVFFFSLLSDSLLSMSFLSEIKRVNSSISALDKCSGKNCKGSFLDTLPGEFNWRRIFSPLGGIYIAIRTYKIISTVHLNGKKLLFFSNYQNVYRKTFRANRLILMS